MKKISILIASVMILSFSGEYAFAGCPVTLGVRSITSSSAILSGRFFGGSFASMAWGRSPRNFTANCGALNSYGVHSCMASPLKKKTKYYYAATNGRCRGKTKSFTTLP
jgi:hypothetical protein